MLVPRADKGQNKELRNIKQIMKIKMYTKGYCGFCFAAKNLLSKRGITFEEIPVRNKAVETEMQELTGGRTVPQILINGKPIGGYTDLVELDTNGRLGNFGGEIG